MPAKNTIKKYLENGYYHIYNRGVEKRRIFLDSQDYGVFLSYLKEYLLPKDEKALFKRLSDESISSIERSKILKQLKLNNFTDEISLIAYCLMSNHFHFMLKQKSQNAIDGFMQSLCTRYSMYFNRKYKRVGSLYQGVYKGLLLTSEEQFLHLSRYIHKQAILQGETLQVKSQPSSYLEYLGNRKSDWVKPEEILSYFSKNNNSLSYQAFVLEKDSTDVDFQEFEIEE